MKRCPIGIQTFKEIVTEEYLYVDKTEFVYGLTHKYKYAFLSRPRRFGKSLLVSTLEAYFKAEKALFNGLALAHLEKEWIEYPVLRFDMSGGKGKDCQGLKDFLNNQLNNLIGIFEEVNYEKDPSNRFANLIQETYNKHHQKIVILIDEYDAPLLDKDGDAQELEACKKVMQSFYSNLKTYDRYIKFGFITGITKFSQLSLFSELNNLTNISMFPEYAAICGITKEEMLINFKEGITHLAEAKGMSYEGAVELLQKNYDGYHFTYPSPDIYNPFSLLNAIASERIGSYWFSSGGTRLAIYALQKNGIGPKELLNNIRVSEDQFDKPFDRTDDVIPLLYQSGYLTIKGGRNGIYTLAVPNKEVREGLFKSLLPNYLNTRSLITSNPILDIVQGLEEDNLKRLFDAIKTAFASVPECNNTDYEGHYQSMLCLVFTLVGQYVDAVVTTATGRVDIVITTPQKIYIFEIKIDKSAEAAMNQIEEKEYAQKFALLKRPIVKIGVNFNTKTRNIDDWMVSETK